MIEGNMLMLAHGDLGKGLLVVFAWLVTAAVGCISLLLSCFRAYRTSAFVTACLTTVAGAILVVWALVEMAQAGTLLARNLEKAAPNLLLLAAPGGLGIGLLLYHSLAKPPPKNIPPPTQETDK